LKKTHYQKRAGGVAQSVAPKFKTPLTTTKEKMVLKTKYGLKN
jgi:hypothetical protein